MKHSPHTGNTFLPYVHQCVISEVFDVSNELQPLTHPLPRSLAPQDLSPMGHYTATTTGPEQGTPLRITPPTPSSLPNTHGHGSTQALKFPTFLGPVQHFPKWYPPLYPPPGGRGDRHFGTLVLCAEGGEQCSTAALQHCGSQLQPAVAPNLTTCTPAVQFVPDTGCQFGASHCSEPHTIVPQFPQQSGCRAMLGHVTS